MFSKLTHVRIICFIFFFFNDTATTEIYTLSLQTLFRSEVVVPDLRGFGDSGLAPDGFYDLAAHARDLHALMHDVLGHERCAASRSEEHTSELQSHSDLVCRLLLEKKKHSINISIDSRLR